MNQTTKLEETKNCPQACRHADFVRGSSQIKPVLHPRKSAFIRVHLRSILRFSSCTVPLRVLVPRWFFLTVTDSQSFLTTPACKKRVRVGQTETIGQRSPVRRTHPDSLRSCRLLLQRPRPSQPRLHFAARGNRPPPFLTGTPCRNRRNLRQTVPSPSSSSA
jgi:hypothetical protein